jgi:hypothetical protein
MCRWLLEGLWMCTLPMIGSSVSLSARGNQYHQRPVGTISCETRVFQTCPKLSLQPPRLVFLWWLMNLIKWLVMQPSHARFGWYPGDPSPGSWERTCVCLAHSTE